jgi:hypothetical protein
MEHGTGPRCDEAGDRLQHRRLAGAVRTEHADDRTVRDHEVDVV